MKLAGMHALKLAAAAVLALAQFPPAAAADNTALIARAREEAKQGKFMIMVSSPKAEKGHQAIMDAFHKRFNLKTDWEWLPLTSPVSGPRVVEQYKSGIKPPSAIGGYPYSVYEAWYVKNNMDVKVDWVGEFGAMFPEIKSAAVDSVLPSHQGRLLRQWDVKYVMVYNTSLVKSAEVPKTVAELADPKWRGRFAMSSNTSTPLDIMSTDLGVERTVELAQKLIANQPRFKPGPPAVVGAIVNGEVAVGLSGYTALAEAEKRKGAPIAWVPMDVLPVGPLFVFMLKDAPQPNLGKLFLAWLVTEGLKLQENIEHLSTYSDKSSPTTKAIATASPNIKVVEIRNEKDRETAERAGREVMKLISGVAGTAGKK